MTYCLPHLIVVAVVGLVSAEASAQSDVNEGNVSFFTSVKLWANEWQISTFEQRPIVLPNGAIAVQDGARTTVSDVKFVPILTIGAGYGNFIASANYFPSTTYDTKGALNGNVSRSEYDITVGYKLLPGLAASIAYKEAKQSKIADLPVSNAQKVRAGLLGLSGSAPIGEGLSIYGNFAYGLGKQDSDTVNPLGEKSYDVAYRIGEFGLSYLVHEGGPRSPLKTAAISVGYRAQVFVTKNVAYGTYAIAGSPSAPSVSTTPIAVQRADVQTTTDGFIVSISATF